MRKSKVLKELYEEILRIPSSNNVDEKKMIAAFERLKKDLGITKDFSYLDNLYVQPFKLEYIESSGGLKEYFIGLDKQKEEKADSYSKLVLKKNKKLISLKSFGKVSNISDDDFSKIILLIRISQYINKNRELYSLEIAMTQILK